MGWCSSRSGSGMSCRTLELGFLFKSRDLAYYSRSNCLAPEGDGAAGAADWSLNLRTRCLGTRPTAVEF